MMMTEVQGKYERMLHHKAWWLSGLALPDGLIFVAQFLSTQIPSVLWPCWLDNRKGIRPVRSWVLFSWWLQLDWSFVRLIAHSVILKGKGVFGVGKGKGKVAYTWYSTSSWWNTTAEVLRYGTCSQGISQFYLHTHMFIRNRNEPYLFFLNIFAFYFFSY